MDKHHQLHIPHDPSVRQSYAVHVQTILAEPGHDGAGSASLDRKSQAAKTH
jgi:hypothetical protein